MDEMAIDREAMGQLAKALAFICGVDHPTTLAFLRLKPSDRRAAAIPQLRI
jgi:hypothetical protein